MISSEKWEIVYHQTLEAVRFLTRMSPIYNVSQLLDEIEEDIMSGKYEKISLASNLEFWNND